MEKQKKILVACIPIVSVVLMAVIILYAVKAMSTTLFVVLLILDLLLLAANIFFLTRTLKKIEKIKLEKKEKEKIVITGDYMTDLYSILGIPIQYNEDGSIKDIYELLGLEPEYDEDGNRKQTIYEMLGIMPKFDKFGNEIPSVLVIKNRVKRIAKVDTNSRVMTRRLTEKEKEELLIKKTLKKKLDEAEQNGDKQKAEAIKKVIEAKKPDKKKDSGSNYSPIKYKAGSGGKAVGMVKPPKFDIVLKNTISGIFENAAKNKNKKTGSPEVKKEKKKKGDGPEVEKTNSLPNDEAQENVVTMPIWAVGDDAVVDRVPQKKVVVKPVQGTKDPEGEFYINMDVEPGASK